MNREIKCKVWNPRLEQMSEPFTFESLLRCEVALLHDSSMGDPLEWIQFTGLHDKNGKEIYEGDILIIEDTYKDIILDDGTGPTEPANHLAPVIFQDGSFGVRIKEKGDAFDKGFWSFISIQDNIGMTLFEVIGNIYENKELLEGK